MRNLVSPHNLPSQPGGGKGLNIIIISNPKYRPHLIREIHLGGDGGEDKTLLPSVGQGELDLTIQPVQNNN